MNATILIFIITNNCLPKSVTNLFPNVHHDNAKAHRSSYNMTFKLKVVAEEKAVKNNLEIAQEYICMDFVIP